MFTFSNNFVNEESNGKFKFGKGNTQQIGGQIPIQTGHIKIAKQMIKLNRPKKKSSFSIGSFKREAKISSTSEENINFQHLKESELIKGGIFHYEQKSENKNPIEQDG